MAKKYTDGIVFASAFSPSGSQPLDNRTVVKSFSDLINETTFGDTKYDGMVVAVLDDQQTYMLIDSKNSTQESSWKKLGADKSPIVKGDAENSAVLDGEYEEYSNKAISQTSMAVGGASNAGLKGWYYSGIDFTNNKIYLSRTQPNSIKTSGFTTDTSITLNDIQGPEEGLITKKRTQYIAGDNISIVCDAKYENQCKITSVEPGIITVDKIPFTSDVLPSYTLGLGKQPDDFTLYSIMPEVNSITKQLTVRNWNQGGVDLGGASLAEGANTYAVNVGAHAEGIQTVAYGQYSHTEGFGTKAGYASHAEGNKTIANGSSSHAEGLQTITNNTAEHAEGKYNVSNSGKTIHSVGIGTAENKRQNAHEITTDGKHYILGIGNYDGKKLDGATDVTTVINNKADKTYVSKEINDRINVIISGAPETFDTLKEIADYIAEDKEGAVDMVSKISKVTTRVETLETDKADIDEVEKAKTVSEDIIIAGGPLADFALSVFPDGKIPSGTTFQDLFMTLLCQNIYPEVTTNTDEVKYKVEIPSFSISATGASNNATVEIGTSITFGSITANNVTVTKTNPQVSGFTHGYSDSLTGDIVNEDSITEEWTVNNISGGTFTLTASSSKFSGTLPTKAENAVYSSCKLSGCTLTVTEGENKYTVTESAPQQIGSHNGISSKFIVSNLGKRENDKKSDAIASETDVKQTPANKSASFTVNGVYPIYTNGVSASTVDSTAATMDGLIEPVEGDGTKLPLVKNGVKFAVSFASQTQAPYTLFVPQGMKITEAYAIDEFVNTYSVDCLNDFKLSNATTTRTVQNNTVTYSIYEWSGTNGANRVRFTVGK